MTLLNELKKRLRISQSITAYDSEIEELAEECQADLALSGVLAERAEDTTDPLIARAIRTYVKANFGYDNPDAEKLQKSYESLKDHLSLSVEYTDGDADAV